MNELIWIENVRQDKYLELVKERDRLRKEAFCWQQEYIRVFGALILEVFERKVECIRKKKMIAYCQAAINRGKPIDRVALQAYLAKEMKAYQKQLQRMVEENKNAQKARELTQLELMKIKRIYHRIAKRIHPDIFPHTQEEEGLMELWLQTVAAYECNDLEALTECEALVNEVLEQLGIGAVNVEIPDVEERIRKLQMQIVEIRETDPYQYRYLLEDADAKEEKKKTLEEELQSYQAYDEQLEELLARILGNGGVIAWQMN